MNLSQHEIFLQVATNVDMNEDATNAMWTYRQIDHVHEHELFLQLLWKQVKKNK